MAYTTSKIKTFQSRILCDLEERVNEWIDKEERAKGIEVTDVKFQTSVIGTSVIGYKILFTALVIYKKY